MTTLIAERHPILRRGLVAMLQEAHPEWNLAEAGTLDQVREICSGARIELLLIDLALPGFSAVALTRLRAWTRSARIAVLADAVEGGLVMRSLAAGASGFILKATPPNLMLRALDLIGEGGVYVSSPLAPCETPAGKPTRPAPSSREFAPKLTGRQRDVLLLLAEGCTTKDIARRLELGVGTVKVHLNSAYRALGARNRLEAVIRAGSIVRH